MKICVFLGPSLPQTEASQILPALYLPPVAQGDVYRAVQLKPQAIAIIDGFFEHMPSVWHKEILWAMKQGIHVFGASSLGALRAAELSAFGMVGIGHIFEQFKAGVLEDDDEVAVAHGSAEDAYANFSTAMVDIRQTLLRAQATGILGKVSHQTLLDYAKSLFYPRRNYAALLAYAREQGIPEYEIFNQWLPQHQVNQKREDALQLLHHLQDWLGSELEPKKVRYTFQHTRLWESARSRAGKVDLTGFSIHTNALLDELRLQGQLYQDLFEQARTRFLSLMFSESQPFLSSEADLEAALNDFRAEHHLSSDADFEQWLTDHQLSQLELTNLIEDEARVEQVSEMLHTGILNYFSNYLRFQNIYADLVQRLQDKQGVLAELGMTQATLADVGLTESDLYHWYFQIYLQVSFPTDLENYIRQMGLKHLSAFRQLVLKEYCYQSYRRT